MARVGLEVAGTRGLNAQVSRNCQWRQGSFVFDRLGLMSHDESCGVAVEIELGAGVAPERGCRAGLVDRAAEGRQDRRWPCAGRGRRQRRPVPR